MQHIFTAGVSYKTAPLYIREQFAVSPSHQDEVIRRLMGEARLSELVVLWTCNRVEIYGVGPGEPPSPQWLMQVLARGPLLQGTEIYSYRGVDAVHHLFSVASGMESMVLGETEITGQVRNAYEKAKANGFTGKRLNRLFQKALETAKAVRSTTAIGQGAASVGSVAVLHAQKAFGSTLEGRRIMVIGAGEMAEKCLRHLVKKGAGSIAVVNRSMDKAELLAQQYGGRAVSFGRCLAEMADVDIVITSTGSPHTILERCDLELVMTGRSDRPLVVIDIAVPRDVAPEAGTVPGVHLHDIGGLEETVRETVRYREQDLALCWAIIGEKSAELEERMNAARLAAHAEVSNEGGGSVARKRPGIEESV